MSELIKNNLGVRSFCCYILDKYSCCVHQYFFIQCFDDIVTYDFTGTPYFMLEVIIIMMKSAILIALVTLLYSYIIKLIQKKYKKFTDKVATFFFNNVCISIDLSTLYANCRYNCKCLCCCSWSHDSDGLIMIY